MAYREQGRMLVHATQIMPPPHFATPGENKPECCPSIMCEPAFMVAEKQFAGLHMTVNQCSGLFPSGAAREGGGWFDLKSMHQHNCAFPVNHRLFYSGLPLYVLWFSSFHTT